MNLNVGEIVRKASQRGRNRKIKKKNRKHEDRVKRSNICLNSRKREKRETVIFEEMMAEIFYRFSEGHQTTN